MTVENVTLMQHYIRESKVGCECSVKAREFGKMVSIGKG